MEREVTVRGTGQVELAAYGLADAEHQVEKELRALWPDALVEVTDVARTDASARIVEEFRIRYRLRGGVSAEGDTDADARKAALRTLRDSFTGSRYERVTWEIL